MRNLYLTLKCLYSVSTNIRVYKDFLNGRLNRDLRATLPINELKGNPLSEGCPISNLHRCKPMYILFQNNIKKQHHICI